MGNESLCFLLIGPHVHVSGNCEVREDFKKIKIKIAKLIYPEVATATGVDLSLNNL